MIITLGNPSVRSLCGGTAGLLISMILSQKLLVEGMLITCGKVWLEKHLHVEKTAPHEQGLNPGAQKLHSESPCSFLFSNRVAISVTY
jgi:hypothetical protein